MKKTLVALLALVLFAVPAGTAHAAPPRDPARDHFAEADDGARIALSRYTPEPGAPLNSHSQPVILMPGASANFNEFDVRTPEGGRYDIDLPDALPGWAAGDPFIVRDPMKLYSLAYYLYDRGYDVWLVNYRGQGRAPNRSTGGWNGSLDLFGIYDVKAAVEKVRALTGRKPVYAGHSMGCTMGLIYLQGCVFGPGWNPRVMSDPGRAAERNGGGGPGALKGFINLDGPIVPATAVEVPGLAWWAMAPPLYINLRPVSRLAGEWLAEPVMMIERLLWAVRECLPGPVAGLVSGLYAVNPDNMDVEVLRYLARYALDGIATHASAQFTDALKHGRLREYYRNGFLGRLIIEPPPSAPGDGYYCYSDNLAKISVPSLTLVDATLDLTDPADVRKFHELKTRHPLDECHLMEGTAHLDMVNGLSAPYRTFPVVGDWLDRLCAE